MLYEVHVRDFSINKNSGVADGNRGKYAGIVQPGTKTPDGAESGLDHLKELGVTHVHLLPVFDYAGGDERQKADEYTWYNWGYGPVPIQHAGRLLRQRIPTAPRGRRNSSRWSRRFTRTTSAWCWTWFSITPPPPARGHLPFSTRCFRVTITGRTSRAITRTPPVAETNLPRKNPWRGNSSWIPSNTGLTEYHVDGFRFDLMGILDRETMQEVYREAKKINPNVIIYGEGWDMEQVLPAG